MQPKDVACRCILAKDIRFVAQLIPSLKTYFLQMGRKIVQICVKSKKADEQPSLKLFFRILNKRLSICIKRKNLPADALCNHNNLRNIKQICNEVSLFA